MIQEEKKLERQFMTVSEISQILGIGMSEAYIIVRRDLPHVKIGKLYRIRKKAFEDWLHRNELRTMRR